MFFNFFFFSLIEHATLIISIPNSMQQKKIKKKYTHRDYAKIKKKNQTNFNHNIKCIQ